VADGADCIDGVGQPCGDREHVYGPAAPTWKKSWGHHPLLVFLDRPEIAGGEGLAGLLRPDNADSNTASDHVAVLRWALQDCRGATRSSCCRSIGRPTPMALCKSSRRSMGGGAQQTCHVRRSGLGKAVSLPVSVAVALVGALGAAFAVAGAAQRVRVRTHQGVDERRHQLTQHIRVSGGESISNTAGQSISWEVVIASIPLLE